MYCLYIYIHAISEYFFISTRKKSYCQKSNF